MLTENFVNLMQYVLTFASAIGVALIGMYANKRGKRDDAYRQLQEELEMERQEKLTNERKAQMEEFKKVMEKLNTVEADLKKVKTEMEGIRTTLDTNSKLTEFTVKYTAQLNTGLRLLASHMIVDNSDRDELRRKLLEFETDTDKLTNQYFSAKF